MMVLRTLFLLTSLLLVGQRVEAGPIYVLKQSDGTIRFTNRLPRKGMGFGPVKVFTGKNAAFSYVGRGNRSRPKTLGRLNREAYKDLIQEASEFFKVEAALIRAVIHAESAFDDRAQSPKGAMGLMQLMPDTAKSLGVRDAYDAKQNIFGGTKYLAYLLKLLQGDVRLALASYNAGPESVKRYGGIPPYNETREYVRKVVELSESYRTPP